MQNYVYSGGILTLTAPYAVASGGGALVGSIFGVASGAVDSGAAGEFHTCGVFTLAKTASQAWSVGDKIYWDDSNKRCDNTSIVGMLIGTATAVVAGGAGDTTGTVKLNGSASVLAQGKQAAVADLVDNGGGATADGTIGAVTAPTVVTDGTMVGTADGAFETVGATNGGDVSGAIKNNFKEVQAYMTAARAADIALTDAVKELSTKLNALLAKLRLAGLIA